MKIVPLFAGIIILNSPAYPDVQEQNKVEKEEKTSVKTDDNSQTIKIHENYPNPF